MVIWVTIIAFALASSIDNLGVGLSYGIRKIEVQSRQNLLIAVICFIFSMSGIYFGIWIFNSIPGVLPIILGAILLVIIGMRIILLAKPRKKDTSYINEDHSGLKGILKNPETLEASVQISWIEAVVLGIALSANALTNGIGAGLLGLSPFAISLTAAIGSFVSMWFGVKVGHKVADLRIGSFTLGQFGTVISGGILLIIAAFVLLGIYR